MSLNLLRANCSLCLLSSIHTDRADRVAHLLEIVQSTDWHQLIHASQAYSKAILTQHYSLLLSDFHLVQIPFAAPAPSTTASPPLHLQSFENNSFKAKL